MDRLRAITAFVRIVERGSLTAAAEALHTSLPSVVRQLAALEAALGARLLNRTTRRIGLTDEGREYYERCRRVLSELDEAEAALSARRVAPTGRLRLTSPVLFGRLHVAPVTTDFIVAHPAVQLDLLLLDRIVDLVEEGVDAGVRIGRLPDSSLVAIPVGQTRRVVCASPAYLKRMGTPKAPADLARHRCMNFTGLGSPDEWRFGEGTRATRVAIAPVLVTNQVDAALDACARGVGVGRFLCYQVRSLLDSGELKRVLGEFEPEPLPIQVIYPHGRMPSSNVRAFVDWTVPRLRARMQA